LLISKPLQPDGEIAASRPNIGVEIGGEDLQQNDGQRNPRERRELEAPPPAAVPKFRNFAEILAVAEGGGTGGTTFDNVE